MAKGSADDVRYGLLFGPVGERIQSYKFSSSKESLAP